jgi:uncharacterized RDD family membrane protein YckC
VSPPPRAALWRRAGAAAVDGAVGLAAWGLGVLWLVIGLRVLRPGDLAAETVAVTAAGAALLGVALHAVYHVGFVWGCGQTPGRMAFGIAVRRGDGGAVGLSRALLRAMGGLGAALTLGILNLLPLCARDRRLFSDWLAGTRVVHLPG